MADGLLSGLTNWIDQRKQAAKASVGLLADNPQEWAAQATARYFPTKEEERQFRMVKQMGGDITQTPYYQKVFDLTQFQGSIKPTTKGLFDFDWFHGTTGDVKQFRKDLLGEATGAASAKEGFFFARDPKNPPQEMTMKSSDPEAIAFLKRLGKTDEEIAALNTVSMKGHGAHDGEPETGLRYCRQSTSHERRLGYDLVIVGTSRPKGTRVRDGCTWIRP